MKSTATQEVVKAFYEKIHELMKSSHEGRIEDIEALLTAGMCPNQTDEKGWFPLIYAAANNQAKTVLFLINAGANPHLRVWNPSDDRYNGPFDPTKGPNVGTNVSAKKIH